MIKYKNHFYVAISFISILIYRYYWSSVSQWREDQATNVWIAMTETLQTTPVGLLTSKGIPVTNFMILIGKSFNFIDNLLIATILFSLIQVLCFYLLVKELNLTDGKKLSLLLVLSFSTILSSSSVEFWNNWIFTQFNCLFFYFYLLFIKSRKAFYLYVMLLISTFNLAIYLAGITTAISMGIIVLYEFVMNRDKKDVNNALRRYFLLITSTSLYLYFVWFKYFTSVKISEILSFSGLSLYDRFNILSDQFLEIPGIFLTVWTKQSSFYIHQIDRDLVSSLTFNFFKIYVEFHKVITVYFLLAIFIILLYRNTDKKVFDQLNFRLLMSISFFIYFSTLINPALGGPDFSNSERMENYIPYYPFYIIIWFLTIDKLELFYIRKIKFSKLNKSLLISVISINLLLSIFTISDNLNYSGDKLTNADVSLVEKMEVTHFIAKDMNNKGIEEATISYQLGGGIWDYIPRHGEKYAEWFPNYPYTIGRVYDYILYSNYSIINEYEGLNDRSFNDSQYIISYIFNTPDIYDESKYTDITFKRLRISIKN